MKNNIFSLSIFAIFAMALSSCGPKETTGVVVNTNDKEIVKVQNLEKINVARELDVTTTLEGYETMNVSPSLTGLIEHIYVEVGDKVKTNDDLVRMDQNQYNTSMLTYNNLKVELSRVEALSCEVYTCILWIFFCEFIILTRKNCVENNTCK